MNVPVVSGQLVPTSLPTRKVKKRRSKIPAKPCRPKMKTKKCQTVIPTRNRLSQTDPKPKLVDVATDVLKQAGQEKLTQTTCAARLDGFSQTDTLEKKHHKMTKEEEKWLKIGKIVASLNLSDFECLPKSNTSVAQRGREVVDCVRKNLKMVKEKIGGLAFETIFNNFNTLTGSLCGISPSSVIKNSALLKQPPAPAKPKRVRNMSRKEKRMEYASRLEENEKERIFAFLQEQWKKENHVTLQNLLEWARDEIAFKHGRTVLAYTLAGMGLCFRKKQNNTIIEERPDLISWREKFLKKRKELEEANAYVAAYDETWAYSGMTNVYAWQHRETDQYKRARMGNIDEPVQGPNKGKDKGTRGIVLAVLTEDGVLKESEKFWVSGIREEDQLHDYHRDMNSDSYENYMKLVIPKISEEAKKKNRPAVLLIDNAPYHNRVLEKGPVKSSRRQELLDFMELHGISSDGDRTNADRYAKCKEFMEANGGKAAFTKYYLDEWAAQYGVELLRLPPYHCYFNPIELLWSQLKGHLRRLGKTVDKIQLVRDRALEFLSSFSAEQALPLFRHVSEIESDIRRISENKRQANLLLMPVLDVNSDEELSFSSSDDDESDDVGDEDDDTDCQPGSSKRYSHMPFLDKAF